MTNGHKHQSALVLSGGGALGAYELGVTKALVSGRSPGTKPSLDAPPVPLDPDIFTGTSIGSFNASYLVSQWETYGAAAVGKLEEVWLGALAETLCGNGGYRIRLNPLDYLNPFCVLQHPATTVAQFATDSAFVGWDFMRRAVGFMTPGDPLLERVIDLVNVSTFVAVEPWEKVIREHIDFNALRKSKKKLSIAATNWTNGEVRVFKQAKMNDSFGPKVIRASSAIPGFYPAQVIGTQQFVDGGVLMNTPLKPAIQQGATTLHVINMNASIVDVALADPPSSMDTIFRQQLVGWAAALDSDIARAAAYNRAIDVLEGFIAMKAAVTHNGQDPDSPEELAKEMLAGNAYFNARGFQPDFHDMALAYNILEKQKERADKGEPVKTYHKLTIHRYYPNEPLGGLLSMLNLKPAFLRELIEEGFADAAAHDCTICNCVLPGGM